MSRFGRMVRATAVLVLVTGAAFTAWHSLPHLERLAGLAQSDPLDKEVTVRMAAAESASDPFHFRPVQSELTLRLGETGIVFYEARNASDHAQSGQGHFTVTPAAAAPYVVRIACFCSSRQALGPGQTADLPVTFYVDPAIVTNPATRHLRDITVTYSFGDAPGQSQQASLQPARQPPLN